MTFPDFLAAHLGARDVLRVDPFPPGASIPPFVVNVFVDREARATYLAGETEALERAHAVARSIRSAGYPAIVRFVESEPRRAPTLPRPVAGWGKS